MHLYNLTLQPSSSILHAIAGNFSGAPKSQDIVLAKPNSLVVARLVVSPDDVARLVPLIEQPVFANIRSMTAFRVTGGHKDYILLGTDSGAITILEYKPEEHRLVKVHCEVFGKSGVRRIVPGEYLAVDPKGRAVMIGALEKQKFVYVLNRDSATRLTISSPLEAHKSHTLTLALTGIDVDFDNPIFAALEVDYSEIDQAAMAGDPSVAYADKHLTFYELDLGLNHVVRKSSDPIDASAHHLIPIPGGADGPSGVLVCAENVLAWRHMEPGVPEIRCPLPRRANPIENVTRGLMVVASVVHRLKNRFFVLVQSDEGDLYRVTMVVDPKTAQVADLRIKYFDTVPVASSLVILRAGYLVVVSEFGQQLLYRIEDLGDADEDTQEFSAAEIEAQGGNPDDFVYFTPRDFVNLAAVGEAEGLNPIMSSIVANLSGEEAPQIYALCGRGAASTLRTLRPGIELSDLAVTQLPGTPTGIWTTKARVADAFDAYIVTSFADATVVMAVGESIEEITDSGLAADVQTLHVACMGIDDLVQVHRGGIRHIKGASAARGAAAAGRVYEWRAPPGAHVTHAVANTRQVLVSLASNELVYFELDLATGLLNEFPTRPEMASPVTCLDLGHVPPGRVRNRYAAVGCADSTVRVLALDPDECLDPMSMQALNSVPEALCTVEMPDPTKPNDQDAIITYLHIGLQNGVLIRSTIDPASGELSDARLRFLGPRSPKLVRTTVNTLGAMLALSTRTWLSYTHQGRAHMSPMQYSVPLDYAAGFANEMYPEACVAVSGNTLRVVLPDKLGQPLTAGTPVELGYTPRCAPVLHPASLHMVVAEADPNTYAPQELAQRLEDRALEVEDAGVAQYRETFPEQRYGLIKAAKGKWAGALRVVNPVDGTVSNIVPLDPDESPVSMCLVQFASSQGQQDPSAVYHLVVGTVTGLEYPNKVREAALRTYRFADGATRLELVHVTHLAAEDGLPRAIAAFHGQVAVGVGNMLRLYDLGKKRLLKKAENRQVPTQITWIGVQGARMWIADQQESMHVALYRPMDNRIVVFADDTIPRWVTAVALVDYDTAVVGDKFGNLSVLRLPGELSREIDEDPTGNRVMYERQALQGAAHKLEHVCEYFVGDMITSITKTTLVTGGKEVLVYSTLGGMIGCLVPLTNKDDVEFFTALENQLRTEVATVVGRDHLRFRGMFKPVRHVIDGDLCEQFLSLAPERKQDIGTEMDRSVQDLTKRIEDLRAR
ncbi:CPSF A subunit region-domain-containing protein, partial [Catenaria anguillulae PL171]